MMNDNLRSVLRSKLNVDGSLTMTPAEVEELFSGYKPDPNQYASQALGAELMSQHLKDHKSSGKQRDMQFGVQLIADFDFSSESGLPNLQGSIEVMLRNGQLWLNARIASRSLMVHLNNSNRDITPKLVEFCKDVLISQNLLSSDSDSDKVWEEWAFGLAGEFKVFIHEDGRPVMIDWDKTREQIAIALSRYNDLNHTKDKYD